MEYSFELLQLLQAAEAGREGVDPNKREAMRQLLLRHRRHQ